MEKERYECFAKRPERPYLLGNTREEKVSYFRNFMQVFWAYFRFSERLRVTLSIKPCRQLPRIKMLRTIISFSLLYGFICPLDEVRTVQKIDVMFVM